MPAHTVPTCTYVNIYTYIPKRGHFLFTLKAPPGVHTPRTPYVDYRDS